MKKNKLADLSMDLAVEIIELVKQLKGKRESIIYEENLLSINNNILGKLRVSKIFTVKAL